MENRREYNGECLNEVLWRIFDEVEYNGECLMNVEYNGEYLMNRV